MDRMAGLFVGILPDTLSLLILSDRFRPCSTSHKEVKESIDSPVIVGDLPFHSFSKFKHTHTHKHSAQGSQLLYGRVMSDYFLISRKRCK